MLLAAVSICTVQIASLIGTKALVPAIGWSGGAEAAGSLEAADSLPGRFARWDSNYYLRIAQDGYRPDGTEVAFFPLYPMLVRFISAVSGMSLIWSGFILSVVCFLWACLLLYRWILIDYPHETAIWAVIWFCCFPMTFFFMALYAEGLFLALCIACVYYARRGQFMVSGAAIALAGATRPPAVLLAVPFLLEFFQQRNFSRAQLIRMGVGAAIAPPGAVGYMLLLSRIDGRFNGLSLYLSAQTVEWKKSIAWPWITLYDGLRAALFSTGLRPDWFSRAIAWHDLSYAVLGLAAAVYSLFRLRLSYSLFLFIGMLFYFANRGPFGYVLWSMPRYVAALFPLYLVLALFTAELPKPLRWLLVLASLSILGFLTAWFASGRWVA